MYPGIIPAERLAVALDEVQYALVQYDDFAKFAGNWVGATNSNGRCAIVMDVDSSAGLIWAAFQKRMAFLHCMNGRGLCN